jgi:hypothetical protein
MASTNSSGKPLIGLGNAGSTMFMLVDVGASPMVKSLRQFLRDGE